MSKTIQAVRGFRDVLPEETPYWQQLEAAARETLQSYGYEEIRLPVLEATELFLHSIGEVTDIVEKEMYTFADRNGDSLSLRPEGTAGCVRAAIENGLIYNQTRRLWYAGPMFRHERPQKGRYRQFHQIGVEAFGFAGPDLDAELMFLTARLWRRLGIKGLTLNLNTLGSLQARAHYREHLVTYFSAHLDALDEDSRRRLHTNPLRILDSKNPAMQALIEGAPRLADHLDEESRAHFDALKAMLDASGMDYVVNPRLVRGLDYYSRTVFEWMTDRLGAQGTVCAGGRYDALVERLGGKPTFAAGCALGVERIMALLQEDALPRADAMEVYFAMVGEQAQRVGMALAERLRDAIPGLALMAGGGGGFKSQLKRADKSGARYALVLADEEVARGEIGVKDLRGAGEQVTWPLDELPTRLGALLRTHGAQ